jgi:myo-inositol 2-dehydrogenase/D-chiro-inositol 1-dehydrogenase
MRRPVTIGVVGCGGSRQTYGAALTEIPAMALTALMDVDLAAARLWSKRLRGTRAYADFSEFVAEADAEAVIVTSPVGARFEQIAALIASGRHVLAETPLAPTAAASFDLAQRARAAGTLLVPALHLRFDTTIAEARRRIASGDVGDLRELRCEWQYSSGWGHRKSVVRSWPDVLMRHAVRTLDLARWWLGEAYAVSADIDRGTGARRSGSIANLIVQHDRGVSVHHVLRGTVRARFEYYVATGSAGALEIAAPAVGALDGQSAFSLAVRRAGGLSEQGDAALNGSAAAQAVAQTHRELLLRFACAMREGAVLPVTAHDAAAAQAIMEAALVSSDETVKITLAPPSAERMEPLRDP